MELNTEPLSRKSTKPATIYDAFRLNDVERVDTYIAGGGCLVDADNEGLTFLHHCAAGKQVEPLRKIMEDAEKRGKQLPIDAKDSSGWTALHYAADKGTIEIANLLLDEGSNVNAKDEAKRTPLHLAANAGDATMVALLLKRGAARHFMNVAGWTALRYAEEGKHPEVIALLAPESK
jgi:ankyrin repeat protein